METLDIPWASQVVLVVKNPPANAGDIEDVGSIPGSERSSKIGMAAPVFLPVKFHGQRILAGYSPCGSQRVRHTHTHTHTQPAEIKWFFKWRGSWGEWVKSKPRSQGAVIFNLVVLICRWHEKTLLGFSFFWLLWLIPWEIHFTNLVKLSAAYSFGKATCLYWYLGTVTSGD